MSRQLHKTIFDGMPNAAMILDANLNFVDANQAYCRAVQRDRADMIGKYVFDVFPDTPERIAPVLDAFRKSLAGEAVQMDLRTIDIMSAALNLMDTTEPYLLLSGYRSPKTNSMLSSRSSGVARNSLHMRGQAADLRLTSRTPTQMANAALACRAGGVGRYPRSNFVHMDCGPIRSWRG